MAPLSGYVGDYFLVFERLPFAFDADLPIEIGRGVSLESTPFELLEALPKGDLAFVHPGYQLGGPVCHACLRLKAGMPELGFDEATSRFFDCLMALRLVAPVHYKLEGQFQVDSDIHVSDEVALYHLDAPYIAGHDRFGIADLLACRALLPVMREWFADSRPCPKSAATFFGQVSNGLVSSRQLATIGVFAGLEALFAPRGNKAKCLARSVGHLLSEVIMSSGYERTLVEAFLENSYREVRSREVHGDLWPRRSGGSSLDLGGTFSDVHELFRACLLCLASLEPTVRGSMYSLKRRDFARQFVHMGPIQRAGTLLGSLAISLSALPRSRGGGSPPLSA